MEVPKSLELLLLEAARQNDSREVRVLLGLGAHPNLTEADGTSALHYAAKSGNADLLDALLEHPRIIVDARDDQGITPLMEASRNGKNAAIEKLASRGAQIEAVDDSFRTPLMLAAFAGKGDAVRALLKRGAQPNVKSAKGGYTALHYAVVRSNYTAVVALVEGGADGTIPNDVNLTPLELAQTRNQADAETHNMTQFLSAAGVQKFLKEGSHRKLAAPQTAHFKKKPPQP
ncbi:MAG: ankyrin-3 [Alphaproteobacteria bacterium]|jgi:ankyrin repeat protein|nr:ankyrin-3 [Alphaproteobacteria bacterium]